MAAKIRGGIPHTQIDRSSLAQTLAKYLVESRFRSGTLNASRMWVPRGPLRRGSRHRKGATSMGFWNIVKFSRQAIPLKRGARKPASVIEHRARKRLEHLVAHARSNSEFWRDKLARIRDNSFALTDLPTCNKTELMEQFDRTVTVDDVRRDELAS